MNFARDHATIDRLHSLAGRSPATGSPHLDDLAEQVSHLPGRAHEVSGSHFGIAQDFPQLLAGSPPPEYPGQGEVDSPGAEKS